MAGRVNFKLEYGGQTHRFTSTFRDAELLRVVRIKVASIVGSEAFDMYWKDEDSDIVLDTVDDLFAAVDFAMGTRKDASKTPRVFLAVVSREAVAAVFNPAKRAQYLLHRAAEGGAAVATAAAAAKVASVERKKFDVFISYRRGTNDKIPSLVKLILELRGYKCFIDAERVYAGPDYYPNMLDVVREADHFILFLSPQSMHRPLIDSADPMNEELVCALLNAKNIIPIFGSGFQFPEDTTVIPLEMRSIVRYNGVQWVDDYQDVCTERLLQFIDALPTTMPIARRPELEVNAAANLEPVVPTIDEKPYDVFISTRGGYGYDIASALKVHLLLKGYKVFAESWDRDIDMIDIVREARHFIVVLSAKSMDHPLIDQDDGMNNELRCALENRKNIIPISAERFAFPKDITIIPEDIRRITRFTAVRWENNQQCIDDILGYINNDLGVECALGDKGGCDAKAKSGAAPPRKKMKKNEKEKSKAKIRVLKAALEWIDKEEALRKSTATSAVPMDMECHSEEQVTQRVEKLSLEDAPMEDTNYNDKEALLRSARVHRLQKLGRELTAMRNERAAELRAASALQALQKEGSLRRPTGVEIATVSEYIDFEYVEQGVQRNQPVKRVLTEMSKNRAADENLPAAFVLQTLQKEESLRKHAADAPSLVDQEAEKDKIAGFKKELAQMQTNQPARKYLFSQEQIAQLGLENRKAAADEEEAARISFDDSEEDDDLDPLVPLPTRNPLDKEQRIGFCPSPPEGGSISCLATEVVGQATELQPPLRPRRPLKEHEIILEANMRELAAKLDAMNANSESGKEEFRTDSEGEWEEVEAKIESPLSPEAEHVLVAADQDWDDGELDEYDDVDDVDDDDEGEEEEDDDGEIVGEEGDEVYDDAEEDYDGLSVSTVCLEEFGDFVGPAVTTPELMHPLSAFVQVKKSDGSAPKFEPMHPLSVVAPQPAVSSDASKEEELAMREKALAERETALEWKMAEFAVKMEAMEEKMERLGKRVAKIEERQREEEEPEKKKAKEEFNEEFVRKMLRAKPHTTKSLLTEIKKSFDGQFPKVEMVSRLAALIKTIQPVTFKQKEGKKDTLVFALYE